MLGHTIGSRAVVYALAMVSVISLSATGARAADDAPVAESSMLDGIGSFFADTWSSVVDVVTLKGIAVTHGDDAGTAEPPVISNSPVRMTMPAKPMPPRPVPAITRETANAVGPFSRGMNRMAGLFDARAEENQFGLPKQN